MKQFKSHITLTLDENVIEQIKILAEDSDRPVSQYINLVLKNHLKRLEKNKENKENKE